MARARTVDRVSAVVAAAGAVVVGGWFVVAGVQAELAGVPGRGPVDRAFPFLLAALAVAAFGVLARRSWRLAGTAPAPPDGSRVVPELSAEGHERLRQVLDVLAEARVLPPAVAEPDELAGAVAGRGEPVSSGTVLDALAETGPDGWDALLARHPTRGEQLPDVVRGNVAAARAPRTAGTPRLAWLWTDRTLWVAAPTLSPAELNDVLDQPVHELWEWIDESREH